MPKRRKPLRSYREIAFQKQKGRCCYCSQPMWTGNPESYASLYDLTLKQAQFMQCTGEHLIAHCANGDVSENNIAAACLFCNIHRHNRKLPLEPAKYAHYVRQRLLKQKWHGIQLVDIRKRENWEYGPSRFF